jgi:hypothetical protein
MDNSSNVNIGIGVNLMEVSDGQILRLKDGRIGKVTENMGDGQWVEISFGKNTEPELIHSQDIDVIV